MRSSWWPRGWGSPSIAMTHGKGLGGFAGSTYCNAEDVVEYE